MTIGVAVTTHNRRQVFTDTITNWQQHLPEGAVLVVVDDGSRIPVPEIPGVTVVHHQHAKGVASAKNRAITELMDAGCDHLFLADDDVHPVTDQWWRPYVESPEPHLMLGWPHRAVYNAQRSGWPPRITSGDDKHDAYTFPRGVMLYAARRVIDTVGGMNTAYGAHGGEHVDWSQRIHDAGLTTWPFADVKDSADLFFAHDKVQNTTGSSRFDLGTRRQLCEANGKRWGHRWEGWPWFPYREGSPLRDDQPGPRFDDITAHIATMRPATMRCLTGPTIPAAESGDYLILDRDSEALQDFPGGWAVVGHDEHHWAIRVL